MQISHRHHTIEQLQRRWRGRRVIYRGYTDCYYGWTGYEGFGVIRPFRYYGWKVTCWAEVMANAFGDARNNIFFDRFDEAAHVLDKLMSLAWRMRRLSREPVQYAGWKFFHGNKPQPIATMVGFEWVCPDFNTNSRAPTSPASWRHFMRRHPDDDAPDLADRLGGRMYATYLRDNDALSSV